MQNVNKTETGLPLAFDSKIEDVPGGVTVAVTDLTQSSLAAGTVIGADNNGLYHVVKTFKMQANAADDAVTYRVYKGHNGKVGDIISQKPGAKAYGISAIDTSNAAYDVLTVPTTLGVALTAGDVIVQANAVAAGNTSVLKYNPFGLTGTTIDIVAGDNHLVDCVVRGSARLANIPPISAELKALLPLIRFVG